GRSPDRGRRGARRTPPRRRSRIRRPAGTRATPARGTSRGAAAAAAGPAPRRCEGARCRLRRSATAAPRSAAWAASSSKGVAEERWWWVPPAEHFRTRRRRRSRRARRRRRQSLASPSALFSAEVTPEVGDEPRDARPMRAGAEVERPRVEDRGAPPAVDGHLGGVAGSELVVDDGEDVGVGRRGRAGLVDLDAVAAEPAAVMEVGAREQPRRGARIDDVVRPVGIAALVPAVVLLADERGLGSSQVPPAHPAPERVAGGPYGIEEVVGREEGEVAALVV